MNAPQLPPRVRGRVRPGLAAVFISVAMLLGGCSDDVLPVSDTGEGDTYEDTSDVREDTSEDTGPGDTGPEDADDIVETDDTWDAADTESDAPSTECERDWTHIIQFGTPRDDEVTDLAVDDLGGVVVTGYEGGTTGGRLEPTGNSRGFVRRFDAGGAPDWTTYFDTPQSDVVESITPRPGGGWFVAGRTQGALTSASNAGQYDIFVAVLDEDGQVEATFQHGDEAPQHPHRIRAESRDAFTIGGSDDVFVPTNFVERWENVFAHKYSVGDDGSISLTWSYTPRTDPSDWGRHIAVEDAELGRTFLVGNRSSGPVRGAIVWTLDADGGLLDERTYSAGPFESMNAARLRDGVLFVAGTGFAQFGPVAYGQQDAFVLAIDPRGDVTWQGQTGSDRSDWVAELVFDADGNIVVVGEVVAPESDEVGMNLFVSRLAEDGSQADFREFGTPEDDSATAAAADACGRILVGGFTRGTLGAESAGSRDAFVMQVR